MAQQIDVDPRAIIETQADDGPHEVAPEVAMLRLAIVNVVLAAAPGGADFVLIDAGVPGSAGAIRRAVSQRFGAAARPCAIVMTHAHFDHVGALETLAAEWDVPVVAHALELPYLDGSASYPPPDPQVGGGLLARLSPLYPTAPVDVGDRLVVLPEDGSVPYLPGWRWIATPGHSVGHVSLWQPERRLLVAGDAVVTVAQESAYAVAAQEPELHGPPRYLTADWEAAAASVRSLAALGPEILVTGHGRPLAGAAMRHALERLADEFAQVAVPPEGRYVAQPARAADGSAYRPPR